MPQPSFQTHTTSPMNFLRSLTAAAPVASSLFGMRCFGISAPTLREKYFKITKYARPIDTTVYKAGDKIPSKGVPTKNKLYPDYKYEAMFFKRQNRGLYGGLQRKRSKTCSESKNKNLRAHLPNIVKAKLWSETLNKCISTRVSTRLLRTVTKEGGIDNYLLKDSSAREKTMGLKGWRLRYDIMKTKELQERSAGSPKPVYHVLESGRKITVGKTKLLKHLYPFVYRDNYEPMDYEKFLRTHGYLTIAEVVSKLEHYKFDFNQVSV
ncbi:hypothetical protein METBIDRAFT_64862 [Metschnikowia bicuspidata var. bicuspidata NRRL YB-4993]|uniref:Ribosomal protein L28 n=1 Tax=Metschnikowia bicuspidata var. bicuspidata NRRL YB-4993 TaxID=869754 RepID=A0A1A0HI99_9ASCO|nr:hypothetical protein METBIDRAFT_64862 [Metschnikowia bicuspidata var. bicuspidata NRRL YB-4993]OBA23726.1 hypothetical protein METBIDRAFT_64862 [Metschnikowia bicuspidata var. bicuspidata NRRL YB-4993]